MDDFSTFASGSSRASSHRQPSATFVSPISHSSRLERIRRTQRAVESLEARRRRSLGLLPGETGSQSTSATPSPGKRRKIEHYHAQIEMAPLELELAYCDGGRWKETNVRPESVLYENDEGAFFLFRHDLGI